MFNLNINAEEFVPSENSPFMIEMKWFDELEADFVKMNEWLFDYCPLENVSFKEEEIEEIDEIEFIYECYKYNDEKFKKNVFNPKLETIYEEYEIVKKSYAECLKK